MLDLSGQAALFRAGNYDYTGYLGSPPQTVVFSRAINMASIPADQITSITFDDAYSGAGAYTDVRPDMTILVYDGNSSRLKGRLRVAVGGASSTVLQVNEVSPGTIQLADNDRFDVVEETRVWDKLVEASTLFRKDSRLTYVAQTGDYPPVANGGGMVALMLELADTVATVTFDWTTSYPVDPDNTSGLTYSVDVKDGTITVGSDTSSTCTVTFPPGYREVELTVTDADNSAATTIRIPVDVYHPADRPALACTIDGLRFDDSTLGWACDGIRLPKASEAALASLPDGAPVWYFERELYGGAVASYGSDAPAAGRSQVKFVGYFVRDTLTITAEGDEVVFEALGPLGILEATAALPQLLIYDNTPSNWQEGKGLTVNLFLWYLLYWHSSVMAAFDFLWVDGYELADTAYSRLATEDTSSLAAQLRDLAAAIRVELTCDRLGRLRLVRNPNYLTKTERDARTILYPMTTADVITVEETHEHRRQYKLVVGEGITPGATTSAQNAVYSLAPGKAPGPGTQVDTLTGLIGTQAQVNNFTGERLAELNGTYWDESTKQISIVPKNARWQVPDGYDWCDPAARRFLTFVLPASSNKRGVSYGTGTRWLVRSLDVQHTVESDPVSGQETRGKAIGWVVDHETHGPSGVTDTRPQPSENGLPTFPPFDLNIPGLGISPVITPIEAAQLVTGIQRIALICENGLAKTVNFGSGLATFWTFTPWASIGGDGVTGTVLEWVPSGTSNPAAGWLATSTKQYYLALAAGTTELLHSFAAASTSVAADADRGSLRFAICRYVQGSGVLCLHTDDNSTFDEDVVSSFYATDGNSYLIAPGCYVSDRTAGKIITSAFTSTAAVGAGTPGSSGKISLDGGNTWANSSSPTLLSSVILSQRIHVPWHNNADESIAYFCRTTSNAPPDPTVFIYRANGASTQNITPTLSGENHGQCFARGGMETYVGNRKRLLVIAANNNFPINYAAFLTDNADAASPSYTLLDGPLSNYRRGHIAGDSGATLYVYGEAQTVDLSVSAVPDFVSQQGNLTSYNTGAILGLAGY